MKGTGGKVIAAGKLMAIQDTLALDNYTVLHTGENMTFAFQDRFPSLLFQYQKQDYIMQLYGSTKTAGVSH
ncbi:uncharacterized [Tachysurus ichikawai]